MKLSTDLMKTMALAASCAGFAAVGLQADEPQRQPDRVPIRVIDKRPTMDFATYVKMLDAKGIKTVTVDGKEVVLKTVELDKLEAKERTKVTRAVANAYQQKCVPKRTPRGGPPGEDGCPGCGLG